MVNTSDEPFTVMPGDRIAQLIVARVVNAELHEVDDVNGTARGAAGFGSTGTV
jgi:dUTPase